jgi:Caspase domain
LGVSETKDPFTDRGWRRSRKFSPLPATDRVFRRIVKTWKPFALAAAVVVMLMMTVTGIRLVVRGDEARSVRPTSAVPPAAQEFSRAESTGLFVGVRVFPHDQTLNVPYAVDDAVDLAYRFSLNQRSSLIPPRRVVVAISGRPQKPESQQRLRELKEAGARITGATSGDILNLLQEQAAAAGTRGLLVFSLATHGFIEGADAYILGSSSTFKSAHASLRMTTLFDIALRAQRSLIFVDACRDRTGAESRGAAPDPAAAAPLLNRMDRVHGQVIFYAAAPGKYAYDDHVNRNGVFTRAVLDGLDCAASAPRGIVVAETLHRYVERAVHQWLEINNKDASPPVTQISLEGVTRNMPMSECWRSPARSMRVTFDGSAITAYSETRPLWRKRFDVEIVHAEVADLDADALNEVVIGTREQLIVLDRDGIVRWTKQEYGMSLRAFTTGDLFRKHTAQVVALWSDRDASTSRLAVFDAAARELYAFDYSGQLQHVAIGRPTNMHAPKIAVTAIDGSRRHVRAASLFLFDPKKLASGKPLWRHMLHNDDIEHLRILDVDNDSRRDIVVSSRDGTMTFTFDGRLLR